jgi:hypothetical protein
VIVESEEPARSELGRRISRYREQVLHRYGCADNIKEQIGNTYYLETHKGGWLDWRRECTSS